MRRWWLGGTVPDSQDATLQDFGIYRPASSCFSAGRGWEAGCSARVRPLRSGTGWAAVTRPTTGEYGSVLAGVSGEAYRFGRAGDGDGCATAPQLPAGATTQPCKKWIFHFFHFENGWNSSICMFHFFSILTFSGRKFKKMFFGRNVGKYFGKFFSGIFLGKMQKTFVFFLEKAFNKKMEKI